MTEQWILMIVGAWLIISPWVLGFSDSILVKWSSVLCGIVIVAISFWNLSGWNENVKKENTKE
jgi:hypothetical protein